MMAILSSDFVIQVENLSKSYGDVKAVAGISFGIGRGEVFGFLGPNGAGKTTTLSILEGLRKADGGRVTVLGMDVNTAAAQIKQRIGVQLQNTSLLPDLTVVEQVKLFATLYGRPLSHSDCLDLLEWVGLVEKANVLPGKLSGGQQQRLALVLALVNEPEIVFLDEPTSGLDPQSRRALWALIRECRERGSTVVLTTHYMEEAEALCHRVGIIDHGKLVALDTPGALISRLEGVSSITMSDYLSLDQVRALAGVVEAQHEGELIRIQTKDVTMTLGALITLAQERGISLGDLHLKQPSLEDVFLKLTGHTIRD
jgi:ABC-2 type transport system ATP-binding protein